MNTNAKYPHYLYLQSALIGGCVGIILTTLIVAILLFSNPIEEESSELKAFALRIWGVIFACILGAVLGQIFGVISGRIGFSLKPNKSICFAGAAFGGVVSSILLISMLWL